jgi:hypothetical protein
MAMSKEIKDRLVDALISAFTFAAALTWRDTLVSLMKEILPDEANDIWSELIVSGAITLVVVFLIYTLIKSSRAADTALGLEDEDKEK